MVAYEQRTEHEEIKYSTNLIDDRELEVCPVEGTFRTSWRDPFPRFCVDGKNEQATSFVLQDNQASMFTTQQIYCKSGNIRMCSLGDIRRNVVCRFEAR